MFYYCFVSSHGRSTHFFAAASQPVYVYVLIFCVPIVREEFKLGIDSTIVHYKKKRAIVMEIINARYVD